MLFLNRPKYPDETKDEFREHLNGRTFFSRELLQNTMVWTFQRKIDFAKALISFVPQKHREIFDSTISSIKKAQEWRNQFAHGRIALQLTDDTALLAVLKYNRRSKESKVVLTDAKLKTIEEEMRKAFEACWKLRELLRNRYSSNRAKAKSREGLSGTT